MVFNSLSLNSQLYVLVNCVTIPDVFACLGLLMLMPVASAHQRGIMDQSCILEMKGYQKKEVKGQDFCPGRMV